MTYSINTIKYTARKVVDINGSIFKVRRFTTDEQFKLSELQEAAKNPKLNTAEARKVYDAGTSIFFDVFDDSEKAREVLKEISLTDLADIYKDIMENASDEVE